MIRTLFILLLALNCSFSYSQSNNIEEQVTTPPLIAAIKEDNIEEVKRLIGTGVDIDERDDWMTSPIEFAIRGNNIKLVKLLLDAGAQDKQGLRHAVKNNNTELVNLLLSNDFRGVELVVYAAENNNLEMVKLLVEQGQKTNFTQKRKIGLFKKRYVSPIGFALANKNDDMVRYLVKNGVPAETVISKAYEHKREDIIKELSSLVEDKESMMLDAFRRNQFEIVDYMIQNGASPDAKNKEGSTMLLIAAEQGEIEKVKKCIDKYNSSLHKKNESGSNAIMLAAQSGDIPTLEFLMERDVKFDELDNNGNNALFYSLTPNNLEMLDFLIRKGLDPKHKNQKGMNILMKAASQRRMPTVIKKVLRYGIDINDKDAEGKTAMYYALGQSSLFVDMELVRILLDQGADVNTIGPGGKSLMFRAIEREKLDEIKLYQSKGASVDAKDDMGRRASCDNVEVIKYLIENGADINAVDDRHDSYLCEAIYANDMELAHYLIDKGCDPNQQCYFKEQPIIKAVEKQNVDLVRFLAQNGADIHAVGYFEKNVMDYAQKSGNDEIITYLKSKGAMTKEERNEKYKKTMALEADLQSALDEESLTKLKELISNNSVHTIQQKLLLDMAYVGSKHGDIALLDKLYFNSVKFNIHQEINPQKQTILFIATLYSQEELIKDLLVRGVNVDHVDIHGNMAEDYVQNRSTKTIFKKWRKEHK